MRITRLRFLSLCSSSLVLAAAGPAKLLASVTKGDFVFSEDAFAQLKGATFVAHGPQGRVNLLLENLMPGPQDPSTSQFSVLFAGAQTARLPEGTYTFDHPGLKSFSLFVTPAGSSGGQTLFRADFNLLRG
jgi:hypothetical protein